MGVESDISPLNEYSSVPIIPQIQAFTLHHLVLLLNLINLCITYSQIRSRRHRTTKLVITNCIFDSSHTISGQPLRETDLLDIEHWKMFTKLK